MRRALPFLALPVLLVASVAIAGPTGKPAPGAGAKPTGSTAPTASASAAPASSAKTNAAPAGSASANAAPASSATPSTEAPIAAEIDATARQLFVDGVAAFERQEYAKAYASLLAAWNVKKHWQIAASLGAAAREVGKPVEAATYFAYYERESPADRKEKAKALLAEVAAKVGTVIVTLDPPDAVLLVDGSATEVKSGEALYLEPGKAHALAAKKGEDAASTEVTLDAGQRKQVELIVKKGGAAERSPVPAYVLGGVGLAGLIAGGVLIGVAVDTASTVQSEAPRDGNGNLLCRKTPAPGTTTNPACDALRSKAATGSTAGNAGIGLLVGGGVVLAGAAAYLLWPSRHQPQSGMQWKMIPVVGADSAGAVWMGTF